MIFDDVNRRGLEIEAQLCVSASLSSCPSSPLPFPRTFITSPFSRSHMQFGKVYLRPLESVCPLSVCSADEYLGVNADTRWNGSVCRTLGARTVGPSRKRCLISANILASRPALPLFRTVSGMKQLSRNYEKEISLASSFTRNAANLADMLLHSHFLV